MVIEVQKNNHITFNYVYYYPIADMGAHHASQVMTEHLVDEWIVVDFSELAIDAITQDMILFGEPLKIPLKSWGEAEYVRHAPQSLFR